MLYSAIILGLVSSLHCIGMCGPIAMMLPVDRNNPAKKTLQILTYHAGRLTAYGSLGLIFGTMGRGLYLAGIQQQFSIITGIVMIAIVMVPENIFARYNFSKPVYMAISKVKTGLGSRFRKKGYRSLYTAGVLNGFLPCGLVYAALFGAIAMQSVPLGMLYMMLFGAGTIPLMSMVVYASGILKNPLRNSFSKIVPYAAVAIGMLFIVRGLGLSIPYLSPGDLSLFVTSAPDCVTPGH
ncbi:sulfite exporter TauE/SafE family protein [Flavobacterium sp. MFBS3-15]|uniref:sulfite exporter TauE/SafE family protein n=1 Tax=Flavobacterium sp. MFBS3-15 TaxID=2989816 RepID=UPI002236195F|nr:sulfite exporter TauE/SafE family protein [Flavobacterium sp. MFBS3-15]MCW4469672.1 sulfite exporter TauE/SafE family protein [Flavobacterium sp. MFBS3-15]